MMVITLMIATILISCGVTEETLTVQGCVTDVDFRFEVGGSADIRETYLKFADDEIVQFDGLHYDFFRGKCYKIRYGGVSKRIKSFSVINEKVSAGTP